MRRRRPEAGTDAAAAAHWTAEGQWWTARAQVDTPLDDDEVALYMALHDGPAEHAVDAIHAGAFAAPAVAASLSAAAYAEARRLRGPTAERSTAVGANRPATPSSPCYLPREPGVTLCTWPGTDDGLPMDRLT